MKKYSKGLLRDKNRHAIFKLKSHKHLHDKTVLLPEKTNFRIKIAPCEDQGQCGCCWDFSITNSLRSAFSLIGKDPGALSKNPLLCNCFHNVQENGCNGGDFQAGDAYLGGQGPCLESEWPYDDGDDSQSCKKLQPAATALKWVLVGDGNSKPTAQQLCEAIYNNGLGRCLSIDVAADDNWMNYSGGIYDANTSQEIDHMVRLVDYDSQTSVDTKGNALFNEDGSFKNGDGFFWLRNNWGFDWGEYGDMRTRYGCNNMAETAMFFEVGKSLPKRRKSFFDFWKRFY